MSKVAGTKAGETLSDVLVEAAVRTGRTLQRPWIPPDAEPRRFIIWAILIGLAWHAGWALLLIPRPSPPRTARVAIPALSFLPGPAGLHDGADSGGEARTVWSPVLFALPSAVGFSRPMLQQELDLRPPLDPPSKSVMFLKRAESSAAAAATPGTPLADLVAQALQGAGVLPESSPAFSILPHTPSHGLVDIELSPSLKGAEPRELPRLEVRRLPANKPWEAVAYVVISASGEMERVLLEEPTPSARWNDLLVRALWQLRFDDLADERRGRITIRFAGDTQQAAAAPEGGGR